MCAPRRGIVQRSHGLQRARHRVPERQAFAGGAVGAGLEWPPLRPEREGKWTVWRCEDGKR